MLFLFSVTAPESLTPFIRAVLALALAWSAVDWEGWHYRIKSYQSALADKGLVQSMSRKGNCLDNAVMENFFGHLKEEMYYRRDYRSVEELENAVNEYITYWNQKRIKLSLGGLSPVEYRTEYQKAG